MNTLITPRVSLTTQLREAIDNTPPRREWVSIDRELAQKILNKLDGLPSTPDPFSKRERRILTTLREADGAICDSQLLLKRCDIKTIGALWAQVCRLRRKMQALGMTEQIKTVNCDGYYLKEGN